MSNRPSLDELAALLKALGPLGAAEAKQPPPVEKWNPAHCGEAGLEILSDGSWRHEGTRIARDSLVRLFASILRKDEDGETFVVTPAEKIRVRVEDAPFVAIRADRHGEGEAQTVLFTTNVGDVVALDAAHPLRVATRNGEPRPYVLVRGRLEARILRAPFYELVDWAAPRAGALGLWSGGVWWELGAT